MSTPSEEKNGNGRGENQDRGCKNTVENVLNDESIGPAKTEMDLPRQDSCETKSSWSSWGENWGVTSILSTASEGMCSITQGITNVIESGLGVPQQSTVTKPDATLLDKMKETSFKEENGREVDNRKKVSVIEGIFGGVSNISTKVINTGLDTLETLGKKTMEVLQEGDPGLKKKRALFTSDEKPKLSELLREAQAVHIPQSGMNPVSSRCAQFDKLFDDFNGIIHLEALEMIADQSALKIKNYLEDCSHESRCDIEETFAKLNEITEFNFVDEEDKVESTEFSSILLNGLKNLQVSVTAERLLQTSNHVEEKLSGCQESDIHTKAITTLAMFTALSMELFHRVGECLIVKTHRQPALEADDLFELSKVIIMRANTIGAYYSDNLMALNENSKHITNIFLEVSNSVSFINKAYRMFLPVLQVGAINT